MTTDRQIIESAIGNIQDGIAGVKMIKNALGMTEKSHIEVDLEAAIKRLEKLLI